MDGKWYFVTGASVRPKGRPDLSAILPELLVGEYPCPEDVEWLAREHGVSAVVSLQDDADLASKDLKIDAIRRECEAHGVELHRHPVADGDVEALAHHLDRIVARLHELIDAGRRVFLHCNAGMNRAPTAAIAYVHVRDGLALEDAIRFVKERRHCVPYVRALEARFGPLAG